ncbi:A24 family peptidase [Photobacterium nomapromontoriensis]|uniref:A24 family peptidase n=1 Tax=Photobacterium nomapromontoriensis TaxID=2910237 RepID=UPI003D107FF6
MYIMFALGGFLALISISDITFRRIPNIAIVVILGITFILNGQHDVLNGWYSAIIVLCLSIILVAMKVIAAGDSKLATVLALAIPLSSLLLALWLTCLIGGMLALIYWVKYRIANKTLSGKDPGLPYGVAISIGFYIPILAHHL